MDYWALGLAVGTVISGIIYSMWKSIIKHVKIVPDETATKLEDVIRPNKVNGFLEGLLRGLPYPAFVKVVQRDPENNSVSFVMQMVNEAYEKQFKVGEWDYAGKTDYEIWPKEVADVYYQHDATVLLSQANLRCLEPVVSPLKAHLEMEGQIVEFEKQYINRYGIEAIVGFLRPPLIPMDKIKDYL